MVARANNLSAVITFRNFTIICLGLLLVALNFPSLRKEEISSAFAPRNFMVSLIIFSSCSKIFDLSISLSVPILISGKPLITISLSQLQSKQQTGFFLDNTVQTDKDDKKVRSSVPYASFLFSKVVSSWIPYPDRVVSAKFEPKQCRSMSRSFQGQVRQIMFDEALADEVKRLPWSQKQKKSFYTVTSTALYVECGLTARTALQTNLRNWSQKRRSKGVKSELESPELQEQLDDIEKTKSKNERAQK